MEKPLCPRLIDYLVIVGSKCPEKGKTLTPEILHRFPIEDHDDFQLPAHIVYFCQPKGCLSFKNRQRLQERNSFVFTLTDKDSGIVRFGICLNVYRPCYDQSGIQKLTRLCSLTSLCLVSHHPFFSKFREILKVLHSILDRCNEASGHSSHGGCRNAIWDTFSGCPVECVTAVVMNYIKEIEYWILRLLSLPVPVPGQTRVEVQLLPYEPPFVFALPDHTRFSLIEFPLHLPLELLGVEPCLQVLKALMLECKMVVKSRDLNALTMCVLAFVELLYPLQYMFPIIPLLPPCMANAEQLLYAPTPFIIGLPANFYTFNKGFSLPPDIWLVDLDTTKVIPPKEISDELPDFPEDEVEQLKVYLQQALHVRTPLFAGDLEQLPPTEPEQVPKTMFNPLIYGNDPDAADIATRIAMVRFLTCPSILGNISEHARTLRLYPRAVVAFQSSNFLRSRQNNSQFLTSLVKTQSIEYYVEWSLCPDNFAFLRVQTGIYDPSVIGDKAKWFALQNKPFCFSIMSGDSCLVAAVRSEAEEGNVTDEAVDSESDDDDSSSDSSEVCNPNDEPLPSYTACDSHSLILDWKKLFSAPTKLYLSSNGDSNADSDEESSSDDDDSVGLTPEVEHQFVDENENTRIIDEKRNPPPARPPPPVKRESNQSNLGDPRTRLSSRSSEDSPVDKLKQFFNDNQKQKELLSKVRHEMTDFASDAKGAVNSLSGLIAGEQQQANEPTNNNLQPVDAPKETKASVSPQPRRVVASDLNTPLRNAAPNNQALVSRRKVKDLQKQQLVDAKTAEQTTNQQFLNEIIAGVLEGQGFGWLKQGRVRKLLEDENYRNFVVSRTNLGLEKKMEEGDYLEDVRVSHHVYKGLLKILQAMVSGLEMTYRNNASGGMASAFGLLEIAHTHYCLKENNDSKASSSQASSGSRDELESVASSHDIMSDESTPTQVHSFLPDQLQQPNDADDHTSQYSASSGIGSRDSSLPGLLTMKCTQSNGFRFRCGQLIKAIPSNEYRVYLFQGLIGKDRSSLWDHLQFWEDAFLDAVSQERDIIGMDQSPGEMMDRYWTLNNQERHRLEVDEDRLLVAMLCNLISFMVMMRANKGEICRKLRRLLGRAHISLDLSSEINTLLDYVYQLSGNDIDLKPAGSRLMHKQSFTVHTGEDNTGQMMFMEVCDDCLILRDDLLIFVVISESGCGSGGFFGPSLFICLSERTTHSE